MASNKAFLMFFVIVLLTVVSSEQLTANEKKSVESGLRSGISMTDTLAKFSDSKTQKMFNVVGKMAGFLGAAGGLVSIILVFLPTQESAELRYMKQQFTLVHAKLDKITTELDNIKDLIKFQNQRAAYLSSSHAILHGHRQMLRLLNELQNAHCSGRNECKRIRSRIAKRYVASLNVKLHVEKILLGAVKSTSVFGDPLLDLVKTTFECDFSKINQFTNGILKLVFKGQQVVMTYEKLMGSKRSITESLNAWLKNVYSLRDKSFAIKQRCFRTIKAQMIRGIRNIDYQLRSPTNADANAKLKSFLEGKYPWLRVIPFSYSAYGPKEHCVGSIYGKFWYMPERNLRKRVLVAGIADKEGTYNEQKYSVLQAMDRVTGFFPFWNNCQILRKLISQLKKQNVWKYISTLNVRRKNYGLEIDKTQSLLYVNKEFYLPYGSRSKHKTRVYITMVLKSMEQARGRGCTLQCHNNGRCQQYPYSSTQYCQCRPFYQGDRCQDHTEAELAKTVDGMLAETLKIPVISDLHFDIKDLRQFIGINFANIQKSITNLETSIQHKFDSLAKGVTTGFKWANFVVRYRPAIQKVEFFAHLFEQLRIDYKSMITRQKMGKLFSKEVLHVTRGIRKALFHLNEMYLGKNQKSVFHHKPILLHFMERRNKAGVPCTRQYKKSIDNFWRKLLLFQQLGYMVWAQALSFLGKKTDIVQKTYQRFLAEQQKSLKTKTCNYRIANSINVQCVGHYLHPGMAIRNRCNRNYYVTGSLVTSCARKRSHCRRCQCYRQGSVNMQCSNFNGKCRCKRLFYGKNCSKRDCVWSNWSRFGSCQRCGYGAKKQRSRSFSVHPVGSGKRCLGSQHSYASCFTGCCRNQFHCSRRRKCIPSSWRCNYDNNCGDNQDEHGCSEHCFEKRNHGTDEGGGNVVFLDRNAVDCPQGSVLKAFKLERVSGRKWRYWYKCCRLTSNICRRVNKHSRRTGLNRKLHSLVHLPVNCPGASYITYFRLSNQGRYDYRCCSLKHNRHRLRSHCYNAHTKWNDDGRGNTIFLDRHHVECRNRYFLSYFKLEHRDNGHSGWWTSRRKRNGSIRYHFKCCKIKV